VVFPEEQNRLIQESVAFLCFIAFSELIQAESTRQGGFFSEKILLARLSKSLRIPKML
jgi:hypothetical protein